MLFSWLVSNPPTQIRISIGIRGDFLLNFLGSPADYVINLGWHSWDWAPMKHLKLIHWKPENVEQVKQLLPDAGACYHQPTTGASLCRVYLCGLSGKTTCRKTRHKNRFKDLPGRPARRLWPDIGELPTGVKVIEVRTESYDLPIWFCISQKVLANHISSIAAQSQSGPIWITWPEQKSEITSEIYVYQFGKRDRIQWNYKKTKWYRQIFGHSSQVYWSPKKP